MPFICFILLLAVFLVSGYGCLRLMGFRPDNLLWLCICVLTGLGIVSFIPFLMELLFIPLTGLSITLALVLCTGGFAIPAFRKFQTISFPRPKLPALYLWPFLLVFLFIAFLSIWRCYYNPVSPRDMIVGPAAIAKAALNEHTMVNSVFSLNHDGNNNQFKPPSITALQIIYQMAGFAFGQVWLVVLSVFFTLFLYRLMITKVHPLIAAALLLLFTAIPEMFAYTYMIIYDYPNMIYFMLSCYFLSAYREDRQWKQILLSALMMGFATYFRAETLFLAVMLTPAILLSLYLAKWPFKKWLPPLCCFVLVPAFAYILPNSIYNNYYLPVHYDIGGLVNKDLSDLGPLAERFRDMNTKLLFSKLAIALYAYFTYIFLAILIIELVWKRRLSNESRYWLFTILVVYLCLPLLGFLLPLMDLFNTTKRGLFKLFPLMLLYMVNNAPLQQLSAAIRRWEEGPAAEVPDVP